MRTGRRRLARGPRTFAAFALTVMALTVFAPAASGAAVPSELVLQSVDTSDYPRVRFTVALPTALQSRDVRFSVTENGVKRPVVSAEPVKTTGRDPIDVVLVLDTSGSMAGAPMQAARAAARGFVQAMGPDDRIAVISFSEEPHRHTDFTSDRASLGAALGGLDAQGETALYDALTAAARLLDGSAARERYVVLLSDGGDTASAGDLDKAVRALQKRGAPVYAIALTSPEYDPKAVRALARGTNGTMLSASEAGQLEELFAGIAQDIQGSWRVVFTSAEPDSPDLEVSIDARSGDARAEAITVVDNPAFTAGGGSTPPVTLGLGYTLGAWNIGLLAGLAVGLAGLGVGLLMVRQGPVVDQLRYYRELRETPADSQGDGEGSGVRATLRAAVAQVAGERGFSADLKTRIERAGLTVRPDELIYFHLLSVVAVGVAVQLLTGRLAIAGLTTVLASFAPFMVLSMLASRRTARFEAQLPDVITLIAGSLRAGWGIQQSLELIIEETAEPASTEFTRVQSETRLGLPLEEALSRMAERLDSADFRWVVSAIGIQREVGGNLAEVLDIAAGAIRERAELRREVSALTAEGRFSAVVLVLLPFFLLIAMSFVAPRYLSSLTASPLGWVMLVVAGALLAVGSLWLWRITKVEV